MSKFKFLRTIIRSLSLVTMVVAALYVIPSVRPARSSRAAFLTDVDLDGDWVCKKDCPAGGEGKTAHIKQRGLTLTFTNEGGGTSKGSFAVKATDWNITAVIEGGNRLVWSNGTVWEKE